MVLVAHFNFETEITAISYLENIFRIYIVLSYTFSSDMPITLLLLLSPVSKRWIYGKYSNLAKLDMETGERRKCISTPGKLLVF